MPIELFPAAAIPRGGSSSDMGRAALGALPASWMRRGSPQTTPEPGQALTAQYGGKDYSGLGVQRGGVSVICHSALGKLAKEILL